MLEHMVDTVLSFEGERQHAYRLLRAIKNRFGSTNELGMFEMVEHGLIEVTNPSKLLLAERLHGVAGSVVVASIEGTRPVLVEVQALVTATHFPSPRRMTTGIDTNRLHLLVAVLEKRVGLHLQMQDTYVNVVGGLKLDEPAVDLAIAVALASSFRDRPTPSHDLVFGEVGLTGEVRGVSRVDQRVQEAVKMGFQRIILPAKSVHAGIAPQGVELIAVQSVEEALQAMLG
jgi:DNA repair protein RadA/Sms